MKKYNICIVGLGYVGLPLAVEFAKKYITVGYDIDKYRINQLKKGVDLTMELSPKKLNAVIKKKLNTCFKFVHVPKLSNSAVIFYMFASSQHVPKLAAPAGAAEQTRTSRTTATDKKSAKNTSTTKYDECPRVQMSGCLFKNVKI